MRGIINLVSFVKYEVLSLFLILVFPYVGVEVLSFFYGAPNVAPSAAGETQNNSNPEILIFWIFLILCLMLIITKSIVYLKRRRNLRFIGFAIILAALSPYLWLAANIVDEDHLAVGLSLASIREDTTTIRRLHFIGADLDRIVYSSSGKHNYTALMMASAGGKAESVRVLRELGANVMMRDSNGKTAAEIARIYGHSELAESLEK